MGKLVHMNRKGDSTVEWDPENAASVRKAKAQFDQIVERHMLTFEAFPGTSKPAEQIKKFKPEAEEILYFARIAGGLC